MLNAEFRKILKKIKQYNIIVIARHISPDPDAIASQISLRDAIKLTFPKKEVYAVGTSVSKFKYYGNLDRIDETNFKEDALLIALDVNVPDVILLALMFCELKLLVVIIALDT